MNCSIETQFYVSEKLKQYHINQEKLETLTVRRQIVREQLLKHEYLRPLNRSRKQFEQLEADELMELYQQYRREHDMLYQGEPKNDKKLLQAVQTRAEQQNQLKTVNLQKVGGRVTQQEDDTTMETIRFKYMQQDAYEDKHVLILSEKPIDSRIFFKIPNVAAAVYGCSIGVLTEHLKQGRAGKETKEEEFLCDTKTRLNGQLCFYYSLYSMRTVRPAVLRDDMVHKMGDILQGLQVCFPDLASLRRRGCSNIDLTGLLYSKWWKIRDETLCILRQFGMQEGRNEHQRVLMGFFINSIYFMCDAKPAESMKGAVVQAQMRHQVLKNKHYAEEPDFKQQLLKCMNTEDCCLETTLKDKAAANYIIAYGTVCALCGYAASKYENERPVELRIDNFFFKEDDQIGFVFRPSYPGTIQVDHAEDECKVLEEAVIWTHSQQKILFTEPLPLDKILIRNKESASVFLKAKQTNVSMKSVLDLAQELQYEPETAQDAVFIKTRINALKTIESELVQNEKDPKASKNQPSEEDQKTMIENERKLKLLNDTFNVKTENITFALNCYRLQCAEKDDFEKRLAEFKKNQLTKQQEQSKIDQKQQEMTKMNQQNNQVQQAEQAKQRREREAQEKLRKEREARENQRLLDEKANQERLQEQRRKDEQRQEQERVVNQQVQNRQQNPNRNQYARQNNYIDQQQRQKEEQERQNYQNQQKKKEEQERLRIEAAQLAEQKQKEFEEAQKQLLADKAQRQKEEEEAKMKMSAEYQRANPDSFDKIEAIAKLNDSEIEDMYDELKEQDLEAALKDFLKIEQLSQQDLFEIFNKSQTHNQQTITAKVFQDAPKQLILQRCFPKYLRNIMEKQYNLQANAIIAYAYLKDILLCVEKKEKVHFQKLIDFQQKIDGGHMQTQHEQPIAKPTDVNTSELELNNQPKNEQPVDKPAKPQKPAGNPDKHIKPVESAPVCDQMPQKFKAMGNDLDTHQSHKNNHNLINLKETGGTKLTMNRKIYDELFEKVPIVYLTENLKQIAISVNKFVECFGKQNDYKEYFTILQNLSLEQLQTFTSNFVFNQKSLTPIEIMELFAFIILYGNEELQKIKRIFKENFNEMNASKSGIPKLKTEQIEELKLEQARMNIEELGNEMEPEEVKQLWEQTKILIKIVFDALTPELLCETYNRLAETSFPQDKFTNHVKVIHDSFTQDMREALLEKIASQNEKLFDEYDTFEFISIICNQAEILKATEDKVKINKFYTFVAPVIENNAAPEAEVPENEE